MLDELTIIIPAFRCAAYLHAAIASALYSPVRRILIADDAGEDETLRVAEGLAVAHPDRIHVLKSPVHRGTAANLNEAVAHVETPFFAKLDGDDILIPGYLESVFPLIEARPRLAVLAGHELRIGADEAIAFQPELLPKVHPHSTLSVMSGAEAYQFIVTWDPNPTSSGAVYRTEAFREVGGFDRNLSWGEDWEIWLRFARRREVAYIDARSALYRIHPLSTTATAMRQNRLCYGYDAVFRRAAELCEHAQVFPLIRRKMFGVTKLYAAAAIRVLARSPHDSFDCCFQAARALSMAVTTKGPAVALRPCGSSATRAGQSASHPEASVVYAQKGSLKIKDVRGSR